MENVNLTNKRKNKKEIRKKLKNYPRITGTLTVYYFFPLPEFRNGRNVSSMKSLHVSPYTGQE